jgi:hypothetical protein
MVVTLETGQLLGRTGGVELSVILEGQITVFTAGANFIHWTPDPNLTKLMFELLGKEGLTRVRVTLKGHAIWSDQPDGRRYLDGQAFGQPGVQVDGVSPRLDLSLPSGGGARATDFEGWFWLTLIPPSPGYYSWREFLGQIHGAIGGGMV